MCGRFTQAYTWQEVHDFLNVFGPPRNLRARYNIAPTMDVEVVEAHEGRRASSDHLVTILTIAGMPGSSRPSRFGAVITTLAAKSVPPAGWTG